MEKKRVTVKMKQPNPLFEGWLTEWRDAERAKDSKTQYCYSTALQSLKKYPLPLKSGKECLILKGFGKKLCQMLDDKLKKAGGGLESKAPTKADNADKVGAKARQSAESNKVKSKHEYAPAYRSGGYAILVTLYEESLGDKSKGYMFKNEIIPLAQNLCDKSFVKSDSGSFYTAWSSMSTLINKGFVTKSGNPAKFSITEAGSIVASRLFKNLKGNDGLIKKSLVGGGVDKENCNKNCVTTKDIYVDLTSDDEDNNKPTSNNFEDKTVQFKSICEDKLNSNYEDKFGFNYEDKFSLNYEDKFSLNYEDKVSSSWGDKAISTFEYKSTDSVASTSKKTCNDQTQQKLTRERSKKAFDRHPSATSISSLNDDELTKPKRGRRKKFEKNPSCASISSETSTNASQEEMFVIAPSTFDIILLVDKQETAGSNVIYDEFIVELQSRNIKFEPRHLKVGDYAWICRCRESNKELVLPYILERKRMDDLGQSIKDGRFYEQKFRLKQSGVQNLIYLVESFEDNKHCGLPLTSLFQAATNTLLQDGFNVKFTDGLRGTVEYLTCMTKILIKMFKVKTLMSCLKQDLPSLDISDDLLALMTFKEFNKSASKTKNLKVQEMFIKQLLQLRGVSVDKALAIVEVYPTPRLLKEAYDSCPAKEGENLLSGIQFGKLRKNVGSIISKTIYQLYTFKQY